MILKLLAFGILLGFSHVEACGWNFTANKGILKSPNYPGHYDNNAHCVWTITTEPGTRVRLAFDSFEVEQNESCAYDSIVIRDGNDPTAYLLGKLCGSAIPSPVTSSGNVMYLEFTSDNVTEHLGFEARWTAGQNY
ncbi:Tolloid-like protein 1 [Elysia marginata]|uniref:Tolloid-like protein 1 n=1 Tax=Elysia marginata TaxID=1093978 RepID=A0AAV4HNW1_9GAST|nr:Tolloid-like protein 1 [Elysia marginata]